MTGIWGAPGQLPPRERTLSLRVEGSAACVSPESFRQDLESALPQYHFVLLSESSERLSLAFRATDGEMEVTIVLERTGAQTFTRKLRARDCDEARVASRFVVSVALGEAGEVSEGQPSGAGAGSSPAQGSPVRTEGPDRGLEPAPLLIAETSKAGGRRQRSSNAKRESDAWLGAHVLVLGGPAPSPLFGGTIGAGWGSRRPGPWSPALSMELGYAAGFPARTELGAASFDWGTLGLSACPSLLPFGPIRVRPCVLSHVGFLRATGSDTFDPGSSTRPWIDVGLRLGFSIPLNKALEISGSSDLSYAFNRDSFLFDSEVFHTVAPFSAGGSLGLLVHLW